MTKEKSERSKVLEKKSLESGSVFFSRVGSTSRSGLFSKVGSGYNPSESWLLAITFTWQQNCGSSIWLTGSGSWTFTMENTCKHNGPLLLPNVHCKEELLKLGLCLFCNKQRYYSNFILSVPKFTANLYCICLSKDLWYT